MAVASAVSEIGVESTNHHRVTVSVPFSSGSDDIGGVLRAYVATLWMDVIEVQSARVEHREHDWPQSRVIARVRVDNNGGEPFETDVIATRAFLRLVQ